VGPRAVLDTVVKRKIPSPSRESNPRTPIVQPVAQRYSDWALGSWLYPRGSLDGAAKRRTPLGCPCTESKPCRPALITAFQKLECKTIECITLWGTSRPIPFFICIRTSCFKLLGYFMTLYRLLRLGNVELHTARWLCRWVEKDVVVAYFKGMSLNLLTW
jgi:hypothetical protein